MKPGDRVTSGPGVWGTVTRVEHPERSPRDGISPREEIYVTWFEEAVPEEKEQQS